MLSRVTAETTGAMPSTLMNWLPGTVNVRAAFEASATLLMLPPAGRVIVPARAIPLRSLSPAEMRYEKSRLLEPEPLT